MRKIFIPLILVFSVLSINIQVFGQGKSKPKIVPKPSAAVINISGSATMYPLMVRWANEYMKINPTIRINVLNTGSNKGLFNIKSNAFDFGMLSRELSNKEKKSGFQATPVAKDALVVFMNNKNPYVKSVRSHGFTYRELIEMFVTQTLDTWYHLNTNAQKIKIDLSLPSDNSGNAAVFASYLHTLPEIMIGKRYNTDAAILDAVKKNVYAIGYASSSVVYDTKTRSVKSDFLILPTDYDDDGLIDENENNYSSLDFLINAINVNMIPSPPARNLYLVKRGNSSKEAAAFLNWILTYGQHYTGKLGFAPANTVSIKDNKTDSRF